MNQDMQTELKSGQSAVESKPDKLSVRVGPDECPSPHSFGNKLARTAWGAVWLVLFRPSFRICNGWRRFLLRIFGARIGKGAKVMPSAKIWAPWNLEMGEYSCLSHDVDCYCVAPVSIGAHATVSQYSLLCTATHDVEDPNMRLVTATIKIGEGAWVCADVFIAPGVTVGNGAVIGARSSVFKDMPEWTVCAGHPCEPLHPRKLKDK
jgi:putative colanic acid biosynthesis acetyltransferase WcaF